MNESISIEYARPEDEAEIMRILNSQAMGLAVSIEEHLVLRAGGIQAVAAVIPVSTGRYLASITSAAKRGGYGGILLSHIIQGGGVITTIARGYSAGFYRKYGFRECPKTDIDEAFRDQCDNCSEAAVCAPVYMKYGEP